MKAADRREVIETVATEVFGERGYHGASVEEIARRAGITVPVIYDHFPSKRALYQGLIERHYANLRTIWFEHAEPSQVPAAIDAWFEYVLQHPFAGRMLFRDTTGDPEIEAAHRAIQDSSRAELLPLMARAAPHLTEPYAVELAWETFRCVLQGLALWWYEHPDVPREAVVAHALQSVAWLARP